MQFIAVGYDFCTQDEAGLLFHQDDSHPGMASIHHFSVIGMWERNLRRDKLDVQYIVPTRRAQKSACLHSLSAAHDISCREEEARASS